VVLIHAPVREIFDGSEELPGGGWPMPPLSEEVALIRLYGAETLAIAINAERLDAQAVARHRAAIERETGLPTCLPMDEPLDALVDLIRERVLGERP
jgi:uncharacterized NAD-dependent epimerase/dehydratase family protein